MEAWESRAHREVARMAHAEWERANRLPNGQIRRRHRPYTLPDEAGDLVACLGARDEERAKAIFHLLTIRGV